MTRVEEVAGWVDGKDRWANPTGVAHLIVRREGSQTFAPACGSKANVLSVVEKTPRASACARCMKLITKALTR